VVDVDLADTMLIENIENELHEQLSRLSPDGQRQVLDFARSLRRGRPTGVPGKSLLAFAGTIPLDDLKLMQAATEIDCERVDADGW
jgi:hypothetical protein